jgi:fructose-bisphosphate aldolase class I
MPASAPTPWPATPHSARRPGLVPTVEPEVLMAGGHTMARCEEVTGAVLGAVFDELRTQSVVGAARPGLHPAGAGRGRGSGDDTLPAPERARRRRGSRLPVGRTSQQLASARLNAMNARGGPGGRSPWPLVFSFARAIQQPGLGIWDGKEVNVVAAQHALLHRARYDHAALRGAYQESMEDKPVYRLVS